MLWEWMDAFIANRENLLKNIYGTWNIVMLDNEDLAQAIHLHLQSPGPWIQAQDVVDFFFCKASRNLGSVWIEEINQSHDCTLVDEALGL